MTRILSLAPSNTEILYALGLGEKLVATTAYCDHPEAAKDTPDVGGWVNAQTELVAEHDPDLAITSTFLQEEIRAALEDEGTEVLHVDPKTVDDVYDSIQSIGERFDCEDRACQLVDEMQEQFEDISRDAPDTTASVYCEEWHEPPNVGGNWVPGLVQRAGGTPVVIDEGTESHPVSAQQVNDADPDCCILHWCGFGSESMTEQVRDRDDWQEIRAVQDDRIFTVDDALLNRPGPRLVDGCRAIQEILVEL